MKKKTKQKLNACLVFALSSSMAFGSIAAPSIPDTVMEEELLFDERNDTTKKANKASDSEAARNDLEDSILFFDDDYPKFATDAFWEWYEDASYEEKEAWCFFIASDKATSSEAKRSYPKFDLESEGFLDWYAKHCVTEDETEALTLNYDEIYAYVQAMDARSAIGLLDFVYNSLHMQIMPMSAIGNLWPDGYGASADFLSDGTGTRENPYVLDSVADLRGLAIYVASGQDSSDTYYKIEAGTYDLNGCWIPIGFPVNADGNYTAFKGHLTAEGAEIVNFGISTNSILGVDGTIVSRIKAQEHVGFFGYLGAGSTVENLLIETDGNTIEGTTNTGILAGRATDASIKNCTVRGYVKGMRNVGGIVGLIDSSSSSAGARTSVIEDCNAEEVAVYSISSDGEVSGVGGIAGVARNTTISDVFVSTNKGAGRHIYGTTKSYSGGIVGIQRNSDIYNSYVSKGEIGDSAAYANGGIVGGYDGGQIKVARFSGIVNRPSSTNNYSACFIGTRVNNAGFTYGENGNIAYLYADSETKANTGICGSKVLDDNNYGLDAHIGYWHSNDRMYTLVTGSNTSPSDDYFYQELEKGILNIMRTGNDDDITINHYTADSQGNPVRGYLLTIDEPRVSGTVAAKITAQIQGSFKPVVTAEKLGAYQAGDRVYVSFVDQSNGNVQFRLDPNKTPNPYYSYQVYGDFGDVSNETDGLFRDGGYWLTMPESDTVISAHYKAAARSVSLSPSKVTLEVTQERTGNRDNPTIRWYATAKDDKGSIVTDGNGNIWNRLELKHDASNPEFYIDSLINGQTNQTFNLMWSTDNTDAAKIINPAVSVNGNAADMKAKFSVNIVDSKMAEKVGELRDKQSAEGNKNSITTNSPYRYHALITGTAQAGDGIDANDPPKGYLDIDINFNIIDNTNVSVHGVALSKNTITYDVVRTLSGDRANPEETYTVNGMAAGSDNNTVSALTATFDPDYFDNNRVKWYLSNEAGKDVAVENDENSTDDGTLNVAVSGTGDKAYYHASVMLKGITSVSCNNATLAPIIADQNLNFTSELKTVPNTVTTYEKYVKVTAHDSNTNSVTDTCKVIVNFKTDDKTEILPTNVTINNASNIGGYRIHYTFESDKNSPVTNRVITRENDPTVSPLVNGKGQQLSATVLPQKDSTKPEYQPYEDMVVWSLANPSAAGGSNLNANDVLAIDPNTGQITVRGYGDGTNSTDLSYSPWIRSLISANRLDGTTVPVRIIATSTRDGSLVDYKDINVTFVGTTMSSEVADGIKFDAVLTKHVKTSLAGTDVTESESWFGTDGIEIDATVTGTDEIPQFVVYDESGSQISSGIVSIGDSRLRSVTATKFANLNKNAAWIQAIINQRVSGNKGTEKLIIKAQTANGASVKEIPVEVNFRYDGVDMKASVLQELPTGYPASPEVILPDTPANTYDTTKAAVNDRTITLDVVATQGHYSINNPETRKWSYGIAGLGNTTYTQDGVKENDAVYTLSGDAANYAAIDIHGNLVPTKGNWETVISAGNTRGSVSGIVTAAKEVDGKTMSDSYKVTINFRYDKAVLESHEETFDVVYTQDSQTNSVKSHWTGDEVIQLKANFSDENGVDITPVWESSDESIATVDADGRVRVVKDTWMKQIIDAAQTFGTDQHSGSKKVIITAKHPTTGATADSCIVTVDFRYDQVLLNRHEEVYHLVLTQTSRTNQPSAKWSGNDIRKLNANVYVEPGHNNRPFWSSEDSSIVRVDDAGNIEPVIDADWMKQIIAAGRFTGQKKAAVNVANESQSIKDSSNITVNFNYENVVMDETAKVMDITLTASGYSNNPTYTIEGNEAQVKAVINSLKADDKLVFTSSDENLLKVDAAGKVTLTLPEKMFGSSFRTEASEFLKEAMRHSYTTSNPQITSTTAVVTAATADGRMADQCNITLNVKYINNTRTYSSGGGGSSSGGGGGGGGGGGSSTSGSQPGGSKSTSAANLPSYVVKGGSWTQNALGHWFYSNARTYTNEWAAVHNPYADVKLGQPTFDWFRFGPDSVMTTGWFTDEAGDTYYLHEVSDNTLGHMVTGWRWIKGTDGFERCYYFNPVSDGFRGRLYKNGMTPDGYTVDATGAWTTNGVVVVR